MSPSLCTDSQFSSRLRPQLLQILQVRRCLMPGHHAPQAASITAHYRVTASPHSNASTLKGPTRPSGSGCSSPVGSAWRQPAASGPGSWAERPEREYSGIRNPSPASCASGATLWRRMTHQSCCMIDCGQATLAPTFRRYSKSSSQAQVLACNASATRSSLPGVLHLLTKNTSDQALRP